MGSGHDLPAIIAMDVYMNHGSVLVTVADSGAVDGVAIDQNCCCTQDLSIDTVEPDYASARGLGQNVTVFGTGFVVGDTRLYVNNAGIYQEVTGITVVDDTEIQCVMPGASGPSTVDLQVRNTDGQVATKLSCFLFCYLIKTISPADGPNDGGIPVTIQGDFDGGTPRYADGVKVFFEDAEATSVVIAGDGKSLTCLIPAGSGVVDVTISNLDGVFDTLPSGFSYDDAVESVSPSSGPTDGGTNVSVFGNSWFEDGARVLFDGIDATSVIWVDETTITCTTPQHAAGAVGVTVINPTGAEDTLENGYTYTTLQVNSIVPNSGDIAGQNIVTINGSGFINPAQVKFGGVLSPNVVVQSGSIIFAKVPAHAVGAVDVQAINPSGETGTKANGYTYVAGLKITGFSPWWWPTNDQRYVGLGDNSLGPVFPAVTIVGNGFTNGCIVRFGNVQAPSVQFINSTKLIVAPPLMPILANFPGYVDVPITVVNPGGATASRCCFRFENLPGGLGKLNDQLTTFFAPGSKTLSFPFINRFKDNGLQSYPGYLSNIQLLKYSQGPNIQQVVIGGSPNVSNGSVLVTVDVNYGAPSGLVNDEFSILVIDNNEVASLDPNSMYVNAGNWLIVFRCISF